MILSAGRYRTSAGTSREKCSAAPAGIIICSGGRRGRLLWQGEATPLREAYTQHRLQVARRKQAGLRTALESGTIRPGGEKELRAADEDIAFFEGLPGQEADR